MSSWLKKTKILFGELIKGKTLERTLVNIECLNHELTGQVIDLGSKSNGPSYYRFLSTDRAEIQFSDLKPTDDGVMAIDLENTFQIQDDTYDAIVLFNVLEHLYKYNNCLSEAGRVLKKGGMLIGSVPFIHPIHYDPVDCFRYSQSSLRNIFQESGFSDICIISIGYGPVTSAYSLLEPFIPGIFRFPLSLPAMGFDKALARIFKNSQRVGPEYYPLQYFFICRN